MVKLFVSIVNFNGSKNTLLCLDSISKSQLEEVDMEVVVLDNASHEVFKKEGKDFNNFKLTILKSDKNLGFSGGQNKIIDYALSKDADYIIILNNDTLVSSKTFSELLKTFKNNKDCGIVSPKIYFEKGYEFHKNKYKTTDLGKIIWYAGAKMDWKNVIGRHRGVDQVDNGQFNKIEETDFASGCCMIIKKEVFKKTGFFDEKYFLYYEDVDFSIRAKNKGFKVFYQPNAVMWHKNAGSSGSGSSLHDYYISRNRLLFGFKHASLRSKLALVKESFKILFSKRKWQKEGVLDFYFGKFGKGSFND